MAEKPFTTKRVKTTAVALFASALTMTFAHAEQVTVETLDCNGDVGFSSFDERRLHKIQEGGCENPFDSNENLQQILLRSQSGNSKYQVLWVTQNEARNIMEQIRANKGIRQQYLQQRNQVNVNVDPGNAAPAAQERSNVPRTLPGTGVEESEALDGSFNIEMIDPSLARSVSHLFIDPEAKERLIVGRVSAGAGLISFSVNGRPVTPNPKGIFRSSIPVTKEKTQIQLVAVDQNGQKETREFWLMKLNPDEPGSASKLAEKEGFGSYHALLIGINDYPHLPDLETAINDVEAIGKILEKKYGFNTYKLINPSRYDLLSMLNKLRKKLTDEDNLLVYYAGHGEYDKQNNRGHWLPTDAEMDNPANWISTVDITDNVNRMSARHIMIVADSCYSGALTRSVNSQLDPGMAESAQNQWYRTISQSPSRTVLTSGGLQPVMDGGGEGHSIFARAFIEALNENGTIVDGTRFSEKIKSSVSTRAKEFGMDQSPEYAELKKTGHEFGDFLLVARVEEPGPRIPDR